MSTFHARYAGTCAEGDPIAPGEVVTYAHGKLAHIECPDEPAPSRDPAPCTSCFLVHRGECF